MITQFLFLGPAYAAPDNPQGGMESNPDSDTTNPTPEPMEEERLDNKGTIGQASEPSERDRSTLRRQNLDPTFGNEGGIGQSIGSGQKKGPSSGLGPKKKERNEDRH